MQKADAEDTELKKKCKPAIRCACTEFRMMRNAIISYNNKKLENMRTRHRVRIYSVYDAKPNRLRNGTVTLPGAKGNCGL